MKAGRPHSPSRAGLIAAATAAAILAAVPAQAEADPKPRPNIRIGNSQFEAADWTKLDGWAEDDHAAAFAAFMTSCKPILRAGPSARSDRPVFRGLHQACEAAVEAKPKDAKEARAFFESNFRPVRITPLGETAGFLTGYYEPIVDGSREPTEEYAHPLYRTPAGLLRGGKRLKTASFARGKAKTAKSSGKSAKAAKSGKARTARKGGRRLVSFYDRAAIDDGILKGRNLEIAYLKDPIDSFFIHIQGSARLRLSGGGMMRVNYESQNGHAYTAVGRFLIDRKIVTKEEMSMERIRQWMTANPDEGKELRRLNKSYVFFRETGLADNEEAVGAQGVSLTPLRSIAVDRNLHVYGTPFFIQAELPIESDQPTTKFRRLMIAQDTGGAIIGPARADIYYGAGDEAGLISGRFKHPGQFVILFPKSVDPFVVQRDIPLPRPRPANIPQDEAKPDLVAVAAPELAKPAAKSVEVKPVEAKPAAVKKPEAKKPESKKPNAKLAVKPSETKKPEAARAGTKPAAKPDAKPKTQTAVAKPASKPADAKPAETKKPDAAKPSVKPAAKPAEAAKPAAAKKPDPKTTETKKPRRTIEPAPPT